VKVRIPTPLRSYTDQRAEVDADGTTLAELLVDLDRRYPGIRFRMVDEQGRIRKHMKVFLNGESERDLDVPISDSDEVVIMQALSGGMEDCAP
jgi:molybdopterin converting factor small subunit